MPLTTNGLPYPARTGVPPDAQADIKLLAEAVDLLVHDTGWTSMTSIASGWAQVSGDEARARAVGKRAFMAGRLTNAAPQTITGTSLAIGNIPATLVTVATSPQPIVCGGGFLELSISTAGVVTVRARGANVTIPAGAYMSFGGVNWFVS